MNTTYRLNGIRIEALPYSAAYGATRIANVKSGALDNSSKTNLSRDLYNWRRENSKAEPEILKTTEIDMYTTILCNLQSTFYIHDQKR